MVSIVWLILSSFIQLRLNAHSNCVHDEFSKAFHEMLGWQNIENSETLLNKNIRRLSGIEHSYQIPQYTQNIIYANASKYEPIKIHINVDLLKLELEARDPMKSEDEIMKVLEAVVKAASASVNYLQSHFATLPGPVIGGMAYNYNWVEQLMDKWPGKPFSFSKLQLYELIETSKLSEQVDLIFYITNIETTGACHDSSGVLAYAATLERDYKSHRPLSGILNLCSAEFDLLTNPDGFIQSTNTIFHEIGHVFVFSMDNFMYFPRKSIWFDIIQENQYGVFLVGEYSTRVAQEYYGCFNNSILPGVPLENDGSPGTARSHVEGRYCNGGAMTGLSFHDVEYATPLFFAVANDSSWYFSSIEDAAEFRFGKGRGCKFFTEKCIDGNGTNATTQWPEYFCTNKTAHEIFSFGHEEKVFEPNDGCTADGLSIATCQIEKSESDFSEPLTTIKESKVFLEIIDDVTFIGGTALNNFCPFYNALMMGVPHHFSARPHICIDQTGFFNSRCIEYEINDKYKAIYPPPKVPNNPEQTGKHQVGDCFNIACVDYNDNKWHGLVITIDDENTITCTIDDEHKRKPAEIKAIDSIKNAKFSNLDIGLELKDKIKQIKGKNFKDLGWDELDDLFTISAKSIEIICPSIDMYCPSNNSKPFACEYGKWSDKYGCCICRHGFYGSECTYKDDFPVHNSLSIGETLNVSREQACGYFHNYSLNSSIRGTKYTPDKEISPAEESRWHFFKALFYDNVNTSLEVIIIIVLCVAGFLVIIRIFRQ